MKTLESIKKSCWTIMKLIFPIYIAVDIAHYSGLLQLVSGLFAPISNMLGLPPEAALALAGGGLFNLYTGIALASPLGLDVHQWTTIAVFLGLFHSIVIEAAVLKKLKIPVWATVTIRFSMAFICSYLVSKFNSEASASTVHNVVELTKFTSFSEMLQSSLLNATKITLKVMVLIAGIIWLFDLIKRSKYFGKKVAEHSWFFNVLVGLLLGVTYGAGLLLNEEASQSRDNLPTAFFLVLCHGIIEETLLFTMFGANGLPVVLARFGTALAATFVCITVLNYKKNNLKEGASMRVAISDRITNPAIEEAILGEKIALTPDENTEVLFVWHQVVDKKYIDALPKLKYIIRYGVGFDKVDTEYAKAKGIIVSNTPDYCTDEVSDTAIAFIMASARGICQYNHEAKSYTNGWQENVITSIKRTSQTKLGIIGAGRIGQSTILKAKALSFQVTLYDPYLTEGTEKVLGVKRVESLDEILAESDIVSLHVPLTQETKGLIDESFLDKMKPGAALINTARGGVLKDLDILTDYLKSGKIKHAFLDVLPQEPAHDSDLFQAWKRNESWLNGRLIINPHSAFYSQEASIEMRQKVAINAKRFLNDQKPYSIVNH